ncbi:tetratricopeptide repeat protein [Candidatus Trichorickettsia mobilis]|uniref:hypothetical protein n=1 Tax=Candidatus Trichorickettsia mobilis TaxID=1346319 RepID=UPI002930BC71|nr:hypothetical protein [Candidatus Trichorickettsia mobilis]
MSKVEVKSNAKTITNEDGTTSISFDESYLLTLYEQKKIDTLCNEIYIILAFFYNNSYFKMNSSLYEFLNHFLQTFFHLICRLDFIIPASCEEIFVRLNSTICNMAAMSSHKTTCVPLSIILSQKDSNWPKILMLLNPYNSLQLSPKLLFDLSPSLASIWYSSYLFHSGITAHPTCSRNLSYALKNVDERLLIKYLDPGSIMFLSTNYDCENDKLIKYKLNQLLSDTVGEFKVLKKPNKKKIAIASAKWFSVTAVYKSLAPLINSLKDDYELTLINFGKERYENMDYSVFKETIFIDPMNDGALGISAQDINVVIYPDIGMTFESIFFSNVRIAPIQVCMYGHPVSTFGSKIDYFIGGQDVEDVPNAAKNYSERLVLIPGLAAQAIWPNYKKQDLYKPQADKIFICCGWAASKYNYPMLLNLRKIIERANQYVVFRIIAGGLTMQNEFIPFCKNVTDVLGAEHVEISPAASYNYYMGIIESSDFAIDSYPFGGFNTVVDYLYLEKPTITYESSKAYGRFASAILRKLKAEDFIAYSDEEYISKTVELINNPEKLKQAQNLFKLEDIKQVIDHLTDNHYFKKAIDDLIKNHTKYSKQNHKDPIIIERDL